MNTNVVRIADAEWMGMVETEIAKLKTDVVEINSKLDLMMTMFQSLQKTVEGIQKTMEILQGAIETPPRSVSSHSSKYIHHHRHRSQPDE
jgi:peptidoglycan hydrolase CwlO-like protein